MRAIDADAFKDYIRGACEEMKHLYKDNGAWAKEITESFCKDIDEQPTIQPEPHWIPVTENCDCDKMDKCEKLQLPPASCSEFPNNSDTISRQAAIDALATMYCKSDEDGYVWIIRRDAWARIDALPPAEPKRGKWIRDGHHIRCDQCGMYMCDTDREGDRIPTEFCPNCGAKMEVDDE